MTQAIEKALLDAGADILPLRPTPSTPPGAQADYWHVVAGLLRIPTVTTSKAPACQVADAKTIPLDKLRFVAGVLTRPHSISRT